MSDQYRESQISYIIPMRNEERYIERCLQSIFAQEYPEVEVYVFDGESTDQSWRIVEKMFSGRKNCYLLRNPLRIQSAAWNEGIRLAQGNILAIVSAHAELAPDYSKNVIETLIRTGADMVGGPTYAVAETYIAQCIALALNSPFGVGNALFHYTTKEIETDTVFMGACFRRVYEQIGGFDEEMVRNQDDEFSYRLLRHGGRIICNPAIRSKYYGRSDLLSLWRQYFQYGFWKVRVLQKHPFQMRLRQFVPPAFITSLLGAILLSLFSKPAPWLLLLIVTLYLTANSIASFLVAQRKGWRYLAVLPIVFTILHTSYGLGFLVGLVRFANKWGNKGYKVPYISRVG